tara:strand:- start:3278 stop:3937 length:660 start_codon:yes stop_codon:yes gene_type:complete
MIVKIKEFLIIYITKLLFAICCGTCKWTVFGEKNLDNAIKDKSGVLISGWHGRFLPISYYAAEYMRRNHLNFIAIAGRHRDAARITAILKTWGYNFIRGSSNKGAADVLKDMKKHIRNNHIICITSDGPKGPIHVAKPSSIKLAMRENATILPITAISNKYWQINSWDKFIFPKPFSKMYVYIGNKVEYDKEKINNDYCSQLLSSEINKIQKINDKNIT